MDHGYVAAIDILKPIFRRLDRRKYYSKNSFCNSNVNNSDPFTTCYISLAAQEERGSTIAFQICTLAELHDNGIKVEKDDANFLIGYHFKATPF